MANSKLKTDYSPEACDQVVALMGAGHTLTGAAGAMEISLETINRWMDKHEEFRDAVSRGKAARVFFLERQMLTSDNTAVVTAIRLGLLNAAPEEWRQKPAVNPEGAKDPIRLFAQQLMGTAIRPRLPETTIVEHEPVVPCATQPQKSEIIDDGDDDDRPRIHTVSREIYEDEG
jgi:hypothetical protein